MCVCVCVNPCAQTANDSCHTPKMEEGMEKKGKRVENFTFTGGHK